jgi:hypothetical protein
VIFVSIIHLKAHEIKQSLSDLSNNLGIYLKALKKREELQAIKQVPGCGIETEIFRVGFPLGHRIRSSEVLVVSQYVLAPTTIKLPKLQINGVMPHTNAVWPKEICIAFSFSVGWPVNLEWRTSVDLELRTSVNLEWRTSVDLEWRTLYPTLVTFA